MVHRVAQGRMKAARVSVLRNQQLTGFFRRRSEFQNFLAWLFEVKSRAAEDVMRQLQAWLLRLRGLFRKDQRDAEFSSELESHLQMHIENNLRAGMIAAEARRQALIKLGGVEQ